MFVPLHRLSTVLVPQSQCCVVVHQPHLRRRPASLLYCHGHRYLMARSMLSPVLTRPPLSTLSPRSSTDDDGMVVAFSFIHHHFTLYQSSNNKTLGKLPYKRAVKLNLRFIPFYFIIIILQPDVM